MELLPGCGEGAYGQIQQKDLVYNLKNCKLRVLSHHNRSAFEKCVKK